MLNDITIMVLAGLVVAVPLAALLMTPLINLMSETLISIQLYLRRRVRNQEKHRDQHR